MPGKNEAIYFFNPPIPTTEQLFSVSYTPLYGIQGSSQNRRFLMVTRTDYWLQYFIVFVHSLNPEEDMSKQWDMHKQ